MRAVCRFWQSYLFTFSAHPCKYPVYEKTQKYAESSDISMERRKAI